MSEVCRLENNYEEILRPFEELDLTEYLANKNKKNIKNLGKYTAVSSLTSLVLVMSVPPEMRMFAILFYCVIFCLGFFAFGYVWYIGTKKKKQIQHVYKGQAIIVCEKPLELIYMNEDKQCKNIKCQVPLKSKVHEGIKVNIVLEDETVVEID